MYLLIQYCFRQYNENKQLFTFHNVSINSRLKTVGHMKLIPFTFHNVSINSGYLLYESKPYPHNLHSIMYLLIRNIKSGILLIKKFTFHNVSINSSFHVCLPLFKTKFTFHNVSINSWSYQTRSKLYCIYIP